jgi:hypothetical protein
MLSSAFNDGGGGSYPSWGDAIQYKPSFGSSGSDSDSSEQWKKALSLAAKRLSQSSGSEEDKYRKQVEFGSAISSSLGEGPDKYTKIYTPAQQAPVYLAGVQGSPGFGGALGTIAGAALGSFVFPGIGTSLGAQLGGAVGGAFG